MDLNIILNRKMSYLFEEYLDSEEFAIDEINRLKKAKEEKDEYFIEKYIVLAKNLVEFFNNWVVKIKLHSFCIHANL